MVAAELRGFLVGAQNDCNGIPSNDRTDAVFNVSVPVGTRLALRRDRMSGIEQTVQERRRDTLRLSAVPADRPRELDPDDAARHGANRAIRSFLTYQDLCFRSFARSFEQR